MSRREKSDYIYRVFIALDLGYINAEQAIESVRHLREVPHADMLVELEQFWQEKQWVAPEDCGEIREAEEFTLQHSAPAQDVDEPKPETVSVTTIADARPYLSVFQNILEAQENPGSLRNTPAMEQATSLRDKPGAIHKDTPVGLMPTIAPPPEGDRKLPVEEQPTRTFSGGMVVGKDSHWRPVATPEQRYKEGHELGRGGLGTVVEVFDQNLGRKVARKTLLPQRSTSSQEIQMFIDEAQVTGQLEHPNIVPIYELGELAGGELYYTMRLLPPKNLDWAIYKAEKSIVEIVKILQQVCMGLEYAHSLGIVHRDIKPANILLGQFGEVLIIDWGVAKISRDTELDLAQKKLLVSEPAIKGTPAYMAPELITSGTASPSIDQYALGVILYEVLTKQLPFHADHIFQLLMLVVMREPIPPSEIAANVPHELEQICLKMLAKKPEDRFASCREVYDRLEEFLEGSKERERRRLASQARIQEARQLAEEYKQNLAEAQQRKDEWEQRIKAIQPWDPVEKKRPIWTLKDKLTQTTHRGIQLFRASIKAFEQALEHEPGHPQARQGLADLYWSKLLEAEEQHDELQQLYYSDAVATYDDGTYTALLQGDGTLHLSTEPEGATLQLFRYEEEDCHLVARPIPFEGVSPAQIPLAMGSYLVKIHKTGFHPISYPVCLQRCEELHARIQMYREEQIGDSYILIPGGLFSFAGDPEAPMGLPLQQVDLDDFLIARYPVTFREYLTFLNELHSQDPDAAAQMIPRSDGEKYAMLDETGQYIPNRSTLFHGPITERYPEGQGYEWNLPVLGVSWFDAVLYCRWHSQKENRRITLPTEQQWEKAAAGADRRIYPWGNQFEATYCKMGRSRRPEELQAEPVGAFPMDQSPYGVCDIVGTISEWTLSLSQAEVDALTEDPKQTVIQRGGGWIASNEPALRIGNRVPRQDGGRSYNTGFRVLTYPITTERREA